jgi:hypothetical protein
MSAFPQSTDVEHLDATDWLFVFNSGILRMNWGGPKEGCPKDLSTPSVNHCRSPAGECDGKLFVATFGPATSPAINNAMSTTAAHRLVAIKAKNARLGRSFGIFKLLAGNSAQRQRLPAGAPKASDLRPNC